MSDKKYECPDCFACQWCSDERCKKCRGVVPAKKNVIRSVTESVDYDKHKQLCNCDRGCIGGSCEKKTDTSA